MKKRIQKATPTKLNRVVVFPCKVGLSGSPENGNGVLKKGWRYIQGHYQLTEVRS